MEKRNTYPYTQRHKDAYTYAYTHTHTHTHKRQGSEDLGGVMGRKNPTEKRRKKEKKEILEI